MDDKRLSLICLAVVLAGIAGFFLTYRDEFGETSIGALLEKEGNTGIVFGRIDYVIKNYPSTIFILTDGNKATVYYPKETDLNRNDFVRVYAQSEYHSDAKEIYAYKVIRDG
jgi:hypothetical protein